MDILDSFGLTEHQRRAATTEGRDIVVTAGAGSGKTRTLVARYLWLLERGLSPREMVAITFTEKAAREMRNRIRAEIRRWVTALEAGPRAERWRALEAGMDAARIGTIHSLCAEILRSHPAEAGVDPLFEVVEEGHSAALRAQAIEDALIWASGDPDASQLFVRHTANHLRRMLARMLSRRLDLALLEEAKYQPNQATAALTRALTDFLALDEVRDPLDALRSLGTGPALDADAGEKLADQIRGLLAGWQALETALGAGEVWGAASQLFRLRGEWMDLRVGKKTSTAKSYLAALREAYDRHAVPWLGGAKGSDPPPDPEAEQALAEDLPQLERLFRMVLGNYRQALDREWGLDFDDLEGGALALLEIPPVRRRWAGEFQAVLVDEFQDTNGRQRAIIDALTEDRPGKLFVVGDARQSIYRFRGADVAVFRDIQTDVEARGGARVDLDLTFRSHQALLNGLDGFLPAFMGTAPDPDRPYAVPYTRLEAFRKEPQAGTREPYLELILGLGERGDDARPEAARALAARLLALKDSGEIKEWDDVALLFRAATGFEAYEPALEAHSIPFVTVAGSGFYNRPEVRDLLNLLQALGEPWDDAAMAGLLRSPAIGMSDAGLYQLRWGPDGRRAFREALMSDLSALSESDQQAAGRAAAFLEALGPLVDRISVAALLKRVIDVLDLRALYAAGDPRLWRNIDKLLDDARASGLVRISAFFQYLRTLREVGAREGEAATEAVGSVSLMTIHKSKGLEFNVVVLADASRKPVERGEPVYIQPDVGLAWKPDRMGVNPIPYAIARWKDGQESAAEENRILYVAATRAREKLIISGHLSRRRGSWSAVGLTGEMLTLLGLDADEAAEELDIWHTLSLDGGAVVGLMVASPEQETRRAEGEAPTWPESDVRAMVVPLGGGETETLDPDLAHDPARDWRATGSRVHPPAVVVGLMVHRALECWLFPGDDGLAGLLETVAFREGLVDPGQRSRAIRRAKRLLDRFKAHPLWEEIGTAEARYHEVPYSRSSDNWIESGVVDLLYRSAEGWELLDFKADELADETALAEAVEEHHPQIARYEAACRVLLGGPVRARLCFLDGLGEVRVV